MAYRVQQDKNVDKLLPPQSLEAEQAVLGAMLKDPDAINNVIEVFDDEEVFYKTNHRMIFKVMLELYEQTDPCDITTVADRLLRNDNLERVGGRVYLVELAESVATTANVTTHASIVLEKALLRQLINTSNSIIHGCYQHEQPVDDLLDIAESNIFTISENRLKKGFAPIKELVKRTIEDIEDMHRGGMSGLKTGFDKLDEITLGMHKGDLIIIAGRPSMGKTSLALNIAEYVATDKNNPTGVAIFSLEMSAQQLVLRMLCSRAKLNQQKVRSGKLKDDDWRRLPYYAGILEKAPLFVDESPVLSALELRAKARRLKARNDIGMIIVDYIQMMHSTARSENRQQEMSVISRSLKALAKELDVPVIAVSQLSRQVEQRGGDKRPQLSDLRESGAIEQDADLVAFVYRPEFYFSHLEKTDPKYIEVEGKAEIIIAKQRNGPTGFVNLAFVKELARFDNLASAAHDSLPAGVDPVDTPF